MEIRELECFLVLADELHFGRTAERLYLSQSRVSQLLRALEHRIGGQLVERTSRRVRLTDLGQDFLADLRPAYAGLERVLESAKQAAARTAGQLRLGFQGSANDRILAAIAGHREVYPDQLVDVTELPLNDPFGALRRGDVDAAIVLLPVAEDDLVVGPVFSQDIPVATVPVKHELADRDRLDVEELAGVPLIGIAGPAPSYWRQVQAPGQTPNGALIPRGPQVRTLQEGLSMVAANRGVMLLCRPTADHQVRSDLVHIPVDGLPDSALALIWRRGESTQVIESFAASLARR